MYDLVIKGKVFGGLEVMFFGWWVWWGDVVLFCWFFVSGVVGLIEVNICFFYIGGKVN